MTVGLLFDSTRCIGCNACSAACKEANGLPLPIEDRTTAYTWTVVENVAGVNVRRLCFHCLDPTCVSVCPVAALAKTADGPVVYDASRCIGCRYCIMACPFGVPKYQWDRPIPIVGKCILCADRVSSGQPTACAAVCPTGATLFGERQALLGEARRRIAAAPDDYVDHVYGTTEAGGTSVLMLAGAPFAKLGMKTKVPQQSLPLLTWQVLSKIPSFVAVGAVFLFGLHWITKRRNEMAHEAARREEKRSIPATAARPTWRAGFWPRASAALLLLFAAVTVLRFARGLGAVTNLSDQFPWGLWIGFDVLCGVGLAAGAFTLMAIVHVFNLRRFEPIVRPALLTGFLGYLLVIAGLLFDLGQPWRIWHALVFWNPHSVMFEVAWCVMLYTTVLALEFAPVVLERLRLERPRRILRSIATPLVIAGVILSTLHQSSLGSLYLIVPSKLHPLWYTPLLPYLFLISAIGAGVAMTILESYLSKRAFGRHLEMDILEPLARGMVVALGVYGLLRVIVIVKNGAAATLLDPGYEARMFLIEMTLGVALPVGLLLIERVRTNPTGLVVAALLAVLGFVMNRLNVSVTGMEGAAGVRYVPSWMEVTVSLGLVALGFVVFTAAVRYLPIFPEPAQRRAS